MRIATWNVNSLKARLERVLGWLERARPDVLLMQETKLTDAAAPHAEFRAAGYELAHHGQGRWNGVAIATRAGVAVEDVRHGFGLAVPANETAPDAAPLAEARMIAARVIGADAGPRSPSRPPDPLRGLESADAGPRSPSRLRVISVYAPNGREVATPFYEAKLAWFAELSKWLAANTAGETVVLGGDLNVAPADMDVWDAAACHGGTHVSPRERAAFQALCDAGLVDAYRLKHPEGERYTWWDYRAGAFHKNFGMRIDHLLVSSSLVDRVVWSEIDREARKGKPIPSDHAPLVIDLDEPGHPFDAGWASADARIAARRAGGR